MERAEILINGLVQGVGLRYFAAMLKIYIRVKFLLLLKEIDFRLKNYLIR
jgi:hypothetical protein